MAAIGMPPHLLSLFVSRPPLEYLPAAKQPVRRMHTGTAHLVDLFEDEPPLPPPPFETPKQRRARLKREKIVRHQKELRKKAAVYDPHAMPKTEGDPFRTLFVARLAYETTEKKLKREFEVYGPIRRVRLVCDDAGKPRGYAFIEYEDDRDTKEAYKQADGRKIDGRRVLVDVERGRTVPGWLPRRLGGGRGPPRCAAAGSGSASHHRPVVNAPAPLPPSSSARTSSSSSSHTAGGGGGGAGFSGGAPDERRHGRREKRSRSRDRGDRGDRGDRDRVDRGDRGDRDRDRDRGDRDRDRGDRDNGYRDRDRDRKRHRRDRSRSR